MKKTAGTKGWLAAVLLIIAGIPTADGAAPKTDRPPLDLFVSAGDSWWFGSWLPVDSPGSIRDSLQMLGDVLNLKRIYWRGEQCDMLLDHDILRKDNLQYYEFYAGWVRHLIQDLHLNQVTVTEAHKRGMEVFLWAPLFDYGGPPDRGGCKEFPYYSQSLFTVRHPEWMPVNRYGVRWQNGPIEFAYPEARHALVKMWVDYVERDNLDGMAFFTYAENYGLRYEDEFGFSPPIVDEFRRRYGVDIRVQEFDHQAWHHLRGEYVTDFLRELKTALAAHHKKLGVRLNAEEPNFPDRWNVPRYLLTAGRMYMDWEKWVREGIVDELEINGSAAPVLQDRTVDNVLQAARGTPINASVLTSRPYTDRIRALSARGVRVMLFGTDDASYLKLAYGDQTSAALDGGNRYAAIRFLSQVAEGRARVDAAKIIPLTRDPNILMRRQALRALGRLGDPSAIPALEQALQDPERCVRCYAISALVGISGPDSARKMIAEVKRTGEFEIFEAVSSALVALDRKVLPDVLAAARDDDVVMRRMALYVLGRRGDREGLPILIAGLKDPDLYARFRAASGLQSFHGDPRAVQALIEALRDPDVVVQDRAATSLAISVVPHSTVKPRLGLESAIGILETPNGPLQEKTLNPQERSVLSALVEKFREFGDGSRRSDLAWGYCPVGNAILAFGAEGGRQLQAIIDQKGDHQLAKLAWQALNLREGMENFCTSPDQFEENALVYDTYPGHAIDTGIRPPTVPYDPTNK